MSNFFTYDDRLIIQKELKDHSSFKAIAKQLGKSPSTISREVRKYLSVVATGHPGFPYNACKNRSSCKRYRVCGDNCIRKSTSYCRLCRDCNSHCPDFVEEICTARFRIPYVCNGCESIGKCSLLKNMYIAENAQKKSQEVISESRSGFCVSEKEIARLNSIISPLAKQGQSVHQIYASNADSLMCSEKTIYNYIDACLFDVRNIDLPRRVKFKAKRDKPEFKIDKSCRIGRNYQDFQSFMENHPDTALVQMDSVMSTVGGKCLLTIHFVESSFMLAFIRDANTSQSVIDIFESLYEKLGDELFKLLFPVILTDNGSEFSNPRAIEYRSIPGTWRREQRTNIFYCDAGCPHQKGAIEVNHELIRRIIPKGKEMDHFTQEDINLMMDHINSYKRKKLNDISLYETFKFHYGEEVFSMLGCNRIADQAIILKPTLLKK